MVRWDTLAGTLCPPSVSVVEWVLQAGAEQAYFLGQALVNRAPYLHLLLLVLSSHHFTGEIPLQE